jgi:endoglucanase
MLSRALAGLAAALSMTLAAGPAAFAQAPAAQPSAPPSLFKPVSAEDQVVRMGRGVNVLSFDPYWEGKTPRFQARHFAEIKKAGFSTVRVNLNAFSHMSPDGRLDPEWVKRLDWVVRTAVANGLIVILDEHDFDICSANVKNCRAALTDFWLQIGFRYQNTPNSVIFELLNEPHDQLTPDVWNGLLRDILKVVRKYNPERTVVIGPTSWNSMLELADLNLPADDRNIVVTVHYYLPMEFTHQGATWAGDRLQKLHGVTWGTRSDLAKIDADFDMVQKWSKAHNRPIFLGEFGALETSPIEMRAAWDSGVARAAEKRGWAWAYWQFDGNFIVWDMGKDGWVRPILDALVPPEGQPAK